MKIDNCNVIVTGAGGNIGKSISIEIAKRGAKVLAIDLNENELKKLNHKNIEYCVCDVSDNEQVSSIITNFTNRKGTIDVLINSAGWIENSPLYNPLKQNHDRRHSIELWEKIFKLNLNTVFIMSSHVVEQMIMRRTRGLIINISSVTASGNKGQSAYSAAKAAVDSLSRSWALELGPLGIRSVCIAPGFIDTESTSKALSTSYIDEWISKTALRRLGSTKDISHTVIYLIENEFITGTTVNINGGLII